MDVGIKHDVHGGPSWWPVTPPTRGGYVRSGMPGV